MTRKVWASAITLGSKSMLGVKGFRMTLDGEWLRLPEQDIAALRGLKWQPPLVDAWRFLPMSDEIPAVPGGSIKTEQDGDDVFLLLLGVRVAKRGRCRGLTA